MDVERVGVWVEEGVRVGVNVLVTLKDFVADADAVYTSPDEYICDISSFMCPYESMHALSGIVSVMSDVIERSSK